jgi:hypothetical protein
VYGQLLLLLVGFNFKPFRTTTSKNAEFPEKEEEANGRRTKRNNTLPASYAAGTRPSTQ